VSDINEPTLADAIIATILISLNNARARGEPWKSLAEEFLGPTAWILRKINKERATILKRHEPPARRLQAMNQRVLVLLESFTDAIWKERGEDQRDPILVVLAPGTPSFFFEWDVGLPPDRLDLLLDVLVGDTSGPAVTRVGEEIRVLLPEYRALCEEVRELSAKLAILDKGAETIARAGHVHHSRLRRRMRADGFEPSEVRRVFPDIPNFSTTDTLT